MATAATAFAAPLEGTATIIDMATKSLPGGSVVDPPATNLRMRAAQKERATKILGSVAAGGLVTGYLGGKNKLPIKALNGKTAKYAAWSVAIFALLLTAICYRRYQQSKMAAQNANSVAPMPA